MNHFDPIERKEVQRSWWYLTIRRMNHFAYRRWWLLWLIFILAVILFFIFCWNCCSVRPSNNLLQDRLTHLDSVLNYDCNCDTKTTKVPDTIPKAPTQNCRVHFSGGVMGGVWNDVGITKIYEVDQISEFVGSGYYPDNRAAFPKAVAQTFDGIAIDKGTRLVLYEKPNFEGRILLDITGPALINNVLWRNDSRYNKVMDEVFPEPLETNYPRSVRRYSLENMHQWSSGSCKITCGQ
jgi:hypothetical protein